MNTPTKHVAVLPLEQQAIRAKCFHANGTFIEFKKEDIEQSIPDRFEAQVRKFGDRLAVKTQDQELTYHELNRTANRLAHAILAQSGDRQEAVALLFEQSASAISSILGVLKAAKINLTLDPSFPIARTIHILEDSNASLLITNNKNLALGRQLAGVGCQLINVDDLGPGFSTENPELSILPDYYANLFYTSGSTGQPKGALEDHRSALHDVATYTNSLHVCCEDRLVLLYSHSISMGNSIILTSLMTGATLCPFDLKARGVVDLAAWLRSEEITVYFSIPAVFRDFIGTLSGKEAFPQLRVIHLGGDRVPPGNVESYKTHFGPDCIFVTGLASVETGRVRQYFLDKETLVIGESVSLGYMVEGIEITLLGEDGTPVGFNQVGEIAVKSCYLSPGYWRMPDQTDAVFLPDAGGGCERTYLTGDLGKMLLDGCLVHMGRKDSQVKIRGYSVAVVEIEAALQNLGGIKEVVVMAREDRNGDQRLVAYLVSAQQPAPRVSGLRKLLKEKLPDYMVPSQFVLLDAIPKLPSGKTDRRALPQPGTARPELDNKYSPPRNTVEKVLGEIWAEILDLDMVGIQDNFVELGGDSLQATRIISRVITTFRVEIPLRSLFNTSTIAQMGLMIAQQQAQEASPEDVGRILVELEALSDEQAQEILAEGSEPSHTSER